MATLTPPLQEDLVPASPEFDWTGLNDASVKTCADDFRTTLFAFHTDLGHVGGGNKIRFGPLRSRCVNIIQSQTLVALCFRFQVDEKEAESSRGAASRAMSVFKARKVNAASDTTKAAAAAASRP